MPSPPRRYANLILLSWICFLLYWENRCYLSYQQEPRLALLTPSNIHNVFLEPQSNDLWSPLQFGFGLDKSLHSLLAAIRPNEYPKSFFKEEQSNNILDIDNGEWDRTKSIFSVGALFCRDVDHYAEGDWGTNLASTQQALLEADSDNGQNYLLDYDTSGDILAINDGDETHSPANNLNDQTHSSNLNYPFNTCKLHRHISKRRPDDEW